MYRKLKICELNRLSTEEFKVTPKIPLVLVLDNIRSQHNIGAAFRTADAFTLEKILLCGICATPPSPEIHKSALGAEESVTWSYINDCKKAIQILKGQGYIIISVEQTENSTMLNDFVPVCGNRYALVFGNEVKGIQQEVVDISDAVVEIPQFGTKHSLNVSVSIGIVVWKIVSAGISTI
ncbi:MAG: TrmH family RNA methyltransferase [Bacteroidales bacterium]